MENIKMNMTGHDVELIKEMLMMQKKLDEAIMKEYELKRIDEWKLNLAILDEVGELTHELKGDWCWWKKTQPPIDKEKVLGELVDIWHFVLSYQNHFGDGEEDLVPAISVKKNVKYVLDLLNERVVDFSFVLCKLVTFQFNIIPKIIAITEYLGFTVEQVYKAYCDKNKVNYQRLESGY